MSDNELKHYGVLGMKWGVRRARGKETTYTYKSHGQKKYEKKLDKAEQRNASSKRIEKLKNKHELYKTRDARRQDYVETTNMGKTMVKGIIMGPFGSGSYNRLRSAGWSRAGASIVSNFVASTFTLPINVLLTRNSETNAARNELRMRERTREELNRDNS